MEDDEYRISDEDVARKAKILDAISPMAGKKAIFVDIQDADKVEAYARKLSKDCPSNNFQKICTMVSAINALQNVTDGLDMFFTLDLGQSKADMMRLREEVSAVMDKLCGIAKQYQQMTYAELDPWKKEEGE